MQDPAPRRPLPKLAAALIQSGLVALFVLASFLLIYRFHSKIAMASLAASAFIAFAFPAAESARARYLAGGYLCGVVFGALCCLARTHLLPAATAQDPRVLIGFCALAVFLTALGMILLGLQHPPATALAVSMVLEPNPLTMGLYMLGCILLLCLVRWALMKALGGRLG